MRNLSVDVSSSRLEELRPSLFVSISVSIFQIMIRVLETCKIALRTIILLVEELERKYKDAENNVEELEGAPWFTV